MKNKSMIANFQEVVKYRNENEMQIAPLMMFAHAWDIKNKQLIGYADEINDVLISISNMVFEDENSHAVEMSLNEIKDILERMKSKENE